MATIKGLKSQVQSANALGIANLVEKGVDISEDATTYEIMQRIADVIGGSSANYKSITFHEDDTITLVDKDDVTHTMSCTYKDEMLDSVTYDGSRIRLGYDDDDNLIKVGATEVKNVTNTRIATSYPPTWFTFEGNVEPSATVERAS